MSGTQIQKTDELWKSLKNALLVDVSKELLLEGPYAGVTHAAKPTRKISAKNNLYTPSAGHVVEFGNTNELLNQIKE